MRYRDLFSLHSFHDWRAPIIKHRDDLTIYTATRTHANFILTQADLHRETQGFLPDSAIIQQIDNGRTLITEQNGDRIGYVMLSAGLRHAAIVRHNTIIEGRRGDGLGTIQMIAACLWAKDRTNHDVLIVRTRGDIDRQIKINTGLHGAVQYSTRNAFSKKKGERIRVYHIPLDRIGPNGYED
jgi:hypothetical protein